MDLDRTLKVIEGNRDLIRGIKVRASQIITGDLGVKCVRLAKCVTSAPRKLLGEPVHDDWLAPGQPADFTAFRIEPVECQTFDSLGAELQMREFILPQLVVLGTEWRRCESRGWQQLASGNQPLVASDSKPDRCSVGKEEAPSRTLVIVTQGLIPRRHSFRQGTMESEGGFGICCAGPGLSR